jgi:hypothetical protein
MMHGFSLVLGSVLAHEWARELVSKAQQLVTYFNASPHHTSCCFGA